MGPFDQTARQVAKEDGAVFFAWLLGDCAPPVPVFVRWDDTRRTSWPDGPERTDDLLAVLRRPGEKTAVWLIVELKDKPAGKTLTELGVYVLMLAAELGEGVELGSAVLHLSGQPAKSELAVGAKGIDKGTTVGPKMVNVCERDARSTLKDIAEGRLGLCALPWVVLMKGGGDPKLIDDWKDVAEGEKDLERRTNYRAWALVFAELTKELVNWQKGLGDWTMQESQIINGWMREGEIKGELRKAREDLLRMIELLVVNPVPEDVRLAVERTNAPDRLRRWLELTATVETVEEYRAAMRQQP